MLSSVITHLQRRREYPPRSEAAFSRAPSCFRAVPRHFLRSRCSEEPGAHAGQSCEPLCAFIFKDTWSCELSVVDLCALPALLLYLSAAALNQVSGRGRVSRVLPLLRTGRRARLSAGGSQKVYTTPPRGLDNTFYIYFR